MVNSTHQYSNPEIVTWLRGLLTIAWADGNYEAEEQKAIATIIQELALDNSAALYKSIEPAELGEILGKDPQIAENFLRTAVIVAVADGVYSPPESALLAQFSQALGLNIAALAALEHTLCEPQESSSAHADLVSPPPPSPELLHPLKDWLDGMQIQDPRLARFICKMVPPQCPFERDVNLFGHKIVHIPPLCKLNPLYEQLVGLRFRALSYLADDQKVDISEYI
jgi:tellurite resistance protein